MRRAWHCRGLRKADRISADDLVSIRLATALPSYREAFKCARWQAKAAGTGASFGRWVIRCQLRHEWGLPDERYSVPKRKGPRKPRCYRK